MNGAGGSLIRMTRNVVPLVTVGVAAVLLGAAIVHWESHGLLAFDFKLAYAERLVEGKTLYPAEGPAANGYPYPPLLALLLTPLMALPTLAAQYLAAFLCVAAVVAALWIVGLRDPYCYAVALLSMSVVWSARMGNISAFVTLLVALAYRFNSAPAGFAVALKLYAWPLLVWGGITRGRRDLAIGLAVAGAGIFLPWALIGFDGITRYVSIVREVTSHAGATYSLPVELALPITALALVGMWLGRHDRVGSFALAVLAMLAATPMLWVYYFSVVLVPLALRRPRFSLAWLIPLAMWAHAVNPTIHVTAMLLLLLWCAVGAPTATRRDIPAWLPLTWLRRGA